MMWYPVLFVLSVFMVLAIVVRRALILGPAMTEEEIELVQSTRKGITGAENIDKWKRAEELFLDKKYFAAEKLYRDVVYHNPNSDKAWARLGAIALTQKRYKDAANDFEKSTAIDPSVTSRFYNLALAYYLEGNKRKASAAITIALEESPEKENYRELKDKIEDLK